jgi:iron complex outermembrane receptor protein
MRKVHLLLGGALFAAASPALAQANGEGAPAESSEVEAAPAEVSEAEAAPAEAPGTEASDEGLEAIVVTALRRTTNLQDTPISISVVDSEGSASRPTNRASPP